MVYSQKSLGPSVAPLQLYKIPHHFTMTLVSDFTFSYGFLILPVCLPFCFLSCAGT